MELLALHKAIKKPPRSDERDGELFYGTPRFPFITGNGYSSAYLLGVAYTDANYNIIVTRTNSSPGPTLPFGDKGTFVLNSSTYCINITFNCSGTLYKSVRGGEITSTHYNANQSTGNLDMGGDYNIVTAYWFIAD